MERMRPAPAGYVTCSVEGILRAEQFTADGEFVGMVYAETWEELAAKLGG